MKIQNDRDALGTRMKENYENRTRFYVPRRTYTIIRLDQKCGHTYTKNLNRPFDKGYIEDIDNAIIAMLPHIQGAVFAYTQSDEISILLTDFATTETSAWFDNNIQKMASVSASIMTAEFNKQRFKRNTLKNLSPLWDMDNISMAHFDSRVFSIPDRTEVMNYMIWRNLDCSRNSVSMLAQHYFSHKELQGKSTVQMKKMLENYSQEYVIGIL